MKRRSGDNTMQTTRFVFAETILIDTAEWYFRVARERVETLIIDVALVTLNIRREVLLPCILRTLGGSFGCRFRITRSSGGHLIKHSNITQYIQCTSILYLFVVVQDTIIAL
jgi:hypothetical protein